MLPEPAVAGITRPGATPDRSRRACTPGRCPGGTRGHEVTEFLRRQLRRTSAQWRAAVVTAVDGSRAHLDCPPGAGRLPIAGLALWHHRPLGTLLTCGVQVLVHPTGGALAVSSPGTDTYALRNVIIEAPGGEVPRVLDFETWACDAPAPLVSLSSARATATRSAWATP